MTSFINNDIFNDTEDQNNRLLNDLSFVKQCLTLLSEYKTFVDLVFDKIKDNLEENDFNRQKEFCDKIDDIFKRRVLSSTLDESNEPNDRHIKCEDSNDNSSEMVAEVKQEVCDIEDETDEQPEQSSCLNINAQRGGHPSKPKTYRKSKRTRFAFNSVVCDQWLANKQVTAEHMRTHKFVCEWPGCDYQTKSKGSLKKHYLNVHTPDEISRKFQCKYTGCDKKFKNTFTLKNHEITHLTEDKSYECDICGRFYRSINSLQCHKVYKHTERPMYSCNYPGCHYKTIHRSYASKHEAIHTTRSTPFACDVEGCGKRFAEKQYLKNHMNSHMTERNFECTFDRCRQTFKTNSKMKGHFKRVHSTEEIRCDWPGCEYVTNSGDKLKSHGLVHKTELDFVCEWPECGKRFKAKKYLAEHSRIHSKDKRFACEWPGCQYRTEFSGNLGLHRRKVHRKQ